ncbi:MAG TPA: hypothetical protein VMT79_10285 [Candidatus Binatia bacterium]|nr:hypothetical protein [Candidatus Binatia bacterium]
MATAAHLIIDGRKGGLPHAAGYYQQFPLEPSPLGDLSIAAERTTVMQGSSLEAALDAMVAAGNGGIVVLICHAFQDGLLLPTAAGGKSALAVVSTMATIDKLIAAEAEVAKIRALPNKTKDEQKIVIDRWTKFLNGLQPGAVTGTFTTDEAEAFYAKFLDTNASNLEFVGPPPRAALQRFIAKVLRVRALKLSRLELRACKIGQSESSMQAVRKFFEADNLTAPTNETFYLSPIPVTTMGRIGQTPPGRRGSHGPARLPGPLRDRLGAISTLQTEESRSTREFLRITTVPVDLGMGPRSGLHLGAITRVPSFTLTIDEVKAFTFRSSAAVMSTGDGVTQDWSRVRAFVNGWVMPNSTSQSGGFPLVGFMTPQFADQPFVLPNETGYTRSIEKVP